MYIHTCVHTYVLCALHTPWTCHPLAGEMTGPRIINQPSGRPWSQGTRYVPTYFSDDQQDRQTAASTIHTEASDSSAATVIMQPSFETWPRTQKKLRGFRLVAIADRTCSQPFDVAGDVTCACHPLHACVESLALSITMMSATEKRGLSSSMYDPSLPSSHRTTYTSNIRPAPEKRDEAFHIGLQKRTDVSALRHSPLRCTYYLRVARL